MVVLIYTVRKAATTGRVRPTVAKDGGERSKALTLITYGLGVLAARHATSRRRNSYGACKSIGQQTKAKVLYYFNKQKFIALLLVFLLLYF